MAHPGFLDVLEEPVELGRGETVLDPNELLHDFFERDEGQTLEHGNQSLGLVPQVSLPQPTPRCVLPECLGEVELTRNDSCLWEYDIDRVQQGQLEVSRHELGFQFEPVFLAHIFNCVQGHYLGLRMFTLHQHEGDRHLHVVCNVVCQDHQNLFVGPGAALECTVDEQLGGPARHQTHELALEHQHILDDLLRPAVCDVPAAEGRLAQGVEGQADVRGFPDVPHDFGSHFVHPPLDHDLPGDFVEFVVGLEVRLDLLGRDAGLLLHLVVDDFLDAHLRVVGEVVPLVAVDVRVFVEVALVAVVELHHHFARAEDLALAVDVEPVLDHALEDGLHSVFLGVSCCVLEYAREVVIPGFDHVVHVVVELEFFFGFDFVFVLVEIVVLFGIKHT